MCRTSFATDVGQTMNNFSVPCYSVDAFDNSVDTSTKAASLSSCS